MQISCHNIRVRLAYIKKINHQFWWFLGKKLKKVLCSASMDNSIETSFRDQEISFHMIQWLYLPFITRAQKLCFQHIFLIASLFFVVKTWKQAIHLRTDECIRKLQNIYSRGYYSTIKEYASLQFAAHGQNY